MDVDGAERVTRGGAKDTPGDNNVSERINGEQFEGRRTAAGRGRGWDNWNSSHGRGPRPSDQSDEAADRQRLLESLIDPQEVPRSGEYFEVKIFYCFV